MAHPAEGKDDDGGLVGDAGVGAVVVLIGANPGEVSEAQGVDEGLVMCGVGYAADEGDGAAFEEDPCFLDVTELKVDGGPGSKPSAPSCKCSIAQGSVSPFRPVASRRCLTNRWTFHPTTSQFGARDQLPPTQAACTWRNVARSCASS